MVIEIEVNTTRYMLIAIMKEAITIWIIMELGI